MDKNLYLWPLDVWTNINKKEMEMKKLMIFAVVMTMFAAMVVACSTPQSAINDLESLIAD